MLTWLHMVRLMHPCSLLNKLSGHVPLSRSLQLLQPNFSMSWADPVMKQSLFQLSLLMQLANTDLVHGVQAWSMSPSARCTS